jgi:hypothetical protein
MKTKEIQKLLDNYPPKYTHGFTNAEIQDITSKIPNINMEKVHEALKGNTCMIIDNNLINYHHDVKLAITCGVQNRDINIEE